jgi:hypothetical protein
MRSLLPAAMFVGLVGCSQFDDLLPPPDGGAGCDSPIKIGDQCAASLAALRLRYALCSCGALVLEHGLFTEGGSGMRGPSAAVGSDDYIQIAGPVQVAGVLDAAGQFGVAFGRNAGVLGSLHSGGALSANMFLSVGGDAFVDGDVVGRMDIGGALHVPPGAFVAGTVSAADLLEQPITVDPPCRCGLDPAVDFASIVSAHSTQNANARISLGADALVKGASSVDLPCGEFFVNSIAAGPELELRVHGRTALYVAGDVTLEEGLRVTLDAGAQLDLVIAGNLTVEDGTLGAQTAEWVRLWIGGKMVQLGRFAGLSASVYSPNAVVTSDGDLSLHGALLAGQLSVAGDVAVHFDADVLASGTTCGAMPEPPVGP